MSMPILEIRRRTSLAMPITIALVVWLIGWIGNVVGMLVSDWTGWIGWLAVPAVSATVAVLGAIASSTIRQRWVDPETHRPVPDPVHPEQYPGPSGRSLPFAIITTIVVAGVLGLGLTAGVRYAAGWVTGNEPGVDRLAQTVTVEDRGLSMSVTAFEETRHFTRLRVQVTNDVGNSISLPLFGNVSLVGADGTAIEVDHRRSDWNTRLNSGVRQNGTLIFDGHLPDQVARATLQFNTVVEQGFDGPDDITVAGIELQPR